MIYMEIY